MIRALRLAAEFVVICACMGAAWLAMVVCAAVMTPPG
jgi:hypothetical protein